MSLSAVPGPAIARVHALYDSLADDVAYLDTAHAFSEARLAGEITASLHQEARLLDMRAFGTWLSLWEPDAALWIPLRPDAHPAKDQSLMLDDHRRLTERVWRMDDKSAWALQPPGQTVRMIGSIEAWWLDKDAGEAIATSAVLITHERLGVVTRLSGRQVHRLRATESGWRLTRKIILSPDVTAGTPHLGWLM